MGVSCMRYSSWISGS